MPVPLPGEVLVKVHACGVCRTDLHVVSGELPDAQIPIVPGPEIVGTIEQLGDGVQAFAVGERVGIRWLGYACEQCRFCRARPEPRGGVGRVVNGTSAPAARRRPHLRAVGPLVPEALARVVRGGVVVCAGIHMSDIPSFPYHLLWHERAIRSVANLTRQDAREFLVLAATASIKTRVTQYALLDANRALADLRAGDIHGAAVLMP